MESHRPTRGFSRFWNLALPTAIHLEYLAAAVGTNVR